MSQSPTGPLSPAAAELLARGDRVLAALSPLDALSPPPPETVRAAAAGLAREMKRLRARLAGGRVEIGLFGLPKAGKSTLLNALAGRQVSATDVLPETAFPIYLLPVEAAPAGAEPPRAKVFFKPGLNRPPVELPPEELGKIHRDKSIWNPKEVAFAEVPSQTEVLGRGFCFIDTPGLEEFVSEYGESSDRLLNDETDAAVLVATPDQAMRDTISRFLELATRRCPRLWIALNVDTQAAGLRPDGTRAVLGTAEFPRLRQRFTERLAGIRGLELMVREGTASVHIFSCKVARDRRFEGAALDALETDDATREFAALAKSARAHADDPRRMENVVRFWTGRLAEFAADTAGIVERSAVRERSEADRLEADRARLEAVRAEQVALENRLRDVLDSGVAEAGDGLRAATVDALGPFFATPLRQAIAGWHRSAGSLRSLHEEVKTALRTEYPGVRERLRSAAAERAGKLAAVMPPVEGAPDPAPVPEWVSPPVGDQPPPELVGDLRQLPVWAGRIAGGVFFVAASIIGWFVAQIGGLVLDNVVGLVLLIIVAGTTVVWQGVKFWTRSQLLTRRWSGWTKTLFLPADTENIRAVYEEFLRAHARAEADAAAGWLRGWADRLLDRRRRPESPELLAARKAAAEQTARARTLETAAAELRSRAEGK